MKEKGRIVFPELVKKDPLYEQMLPDLRKHLSLSLQQNKQIEEDYEKAIKYYREHGF